MHGTVRASVATEELTASVHVGRNVVPSACVSVTVTITRVPNPATTEPGAKVSVVAVDRVFTVNPAVAGPLAEWTLGEVLGVKLAKIVCVLAWAGVTATEQEAAPLAPWRVQVLVNASLPTDDPIVSVPAGVNLVPTSSVSVTVTVTVP